MSYADDLRAYIDARLAGSTTVTPPSIGFTPITSGLGVLYIRVADLLSCEVCHAAVLAIAKTDHQGWHDAMVRADIRWYLGDGTNTTASAEQLMPPPAARTT